MTTEKLRIRVCSSMQEIGAAAWDACANFKPARALPRAAESTSDQLESAHEEADSGSDRICDNPFVSHAFLSALERSGSAVARTGWLGQHLLVESVDGRILGAVPCYLKSHSRGEYVFDAGWADAFEQAGGRYYPKLQVSVPFTPVTGPRLLTRRGAPDPTPMLLLAGLIELARRHEASSVHVTFPTEPEARFLQEHGLLLRTDRQFHWVNQGYASFGDFLGALASRKRKTIVRERREALAPGISVEWLTGSDLTEAVWDAFFEFYMETGSRKWGRPYLTRDFYSIIAATMRERILLVMAKRAGRYIAGAINFIGQDALYGRHWGAIEHHPFLHFELCYYQAIDFAIARGLRRVEAGAQGEHKIARGYLPATTYSAHYIADPAFRSAVADYLRRERRYVAAAAEDLAASAPFRRTGATG